MKIPFIILLILYRSILFGQSINGKLIDIETKKVLSNGNVYLAIPDKTKDTSDIYYWEQKKYKILYTIKTDSFGVFSFKNIAPAIYTLLAYYKMPKVERFDFEGCVQGIDSNIIIKQNQNYFKTIELPVVCKFEKTKNQKFCPKCKKTNKVLMIEYGLPILEYDALGNLKPKPKVYNGGCVMDAYCNATKYCGRCKLEF